jgi:hypothetical protein
MALGSPTWAGILTEPTMGGQEGASFQDSMKSEDTVWQQPGLRQIFRTLGCVVLHTTDQRVVLQTETEETNGYNATIWLWVQSIQSIQ